MSREGISRNKVPVPEGAGGSPPLRVFDTFRANCVAGVFSVDAVCEFVVKCFYTERSENTDHEFLTADTERDPRAPGPPLGG